MNMYVFSPSKNLIYPVELKREYISAGTWPKDAVEISDEMANEFITQSPPGKIRIVVNGLPAWGDIPPPTAEQLVETMELQRQDLLVFADTVTADWRTELMLGEISDADKAKLSAWMAYKREVKAAVSAPWPAKPVL